MLRTRDTLARTPLPMYNEAIRVPQLTAAILSCDVIWYKAYCTTQMIFHAHAHALHTYV